MFRKTNNETEEDDQKVEKSDRENKRHNWRNYLSKDNNQTVDDRDLNVFFARNQCFFEMKIKQRDEIDNMNKKKTRNETNAEDECNKNDCFNTQIEHRKYIDCTQEYCKNQKI